ncbi:hypothetical protein [Saccharospirillum salsuginis]|uniref:DUF3828 domain-containing protein n=1 Tax=Saccharospirillum salsuginis TaxID=418750 RepID=A0A918KH66_9GAMM|nr:hypothetical protein [Saccharospirillum salsuginis]GGX62522.1 hypothetical protein GCM10007392_33030 [Saccharospirillum salsuginis]
MKVLYGLISLFLVACVSAPPQSQRSLYQEFHAFKSMANSNYELAKKTKISRELREHVEQAQKNMPAELRTDFFLNLANNFDDEDSHFEEKRAESGCLTVNGVNQDGRPETLSLSYIKEDGNWVINRYMSHIHDSVNGYYESARCRIAGSQPQ